MTLKKDSKFKKGNIPWNRGKKGCYSKKQIERLKKSHLGKNLGKEHPNWKGGIRISTDGYVMIFSMNHPYKDKNNCVYEHRLVMEKHLGRTLLPTEVVHHINEIKDDNRIENLMLFSSKSEHTRFHKNGRK